MRVLLSLERPGPWRIPGGSRLASSVAESRPFARCRSGERRVAPCDRTRMNRNADETQASDDSGRLCGGRPRVAGVRPSHQRGRAPSGCDLDGGARSNCARGALGVYFAPGASPGLVSRFFPHMLMRTSGLALYGSSAPRQRARPQAAEARRFVSDCGNALLWMSYLDRCRRIGPVAPNTIAMPSLRAKDTCECDISRWSRSNFWGRSLHAMWRLRSCVVFKSVSTGSRMSELRPSHPPVQAIHVRLVPLLSRALQTGPAWDLANSGRPSGRKLLLALELGQMDPVPYRSDREQDASPELTIERGIGAGVRRITINPPSFLIRPMGRPNRLGLGIPSTRFRGRTENNECSYAQTDADGRRSNAAEASECGRRRDLTTEATDGHRILR
jgi:hypothetical protein